jgi:hypothetical protein
MAIRIVEGIVEKRGKNRIRISRGPAIKGMQRPKGQYHPFVRSWF